LYPQLQIAPRLILFFSQKRISGEQGGQAQARRVGSPATHTTAPSSGAEKENTMARNVKSILGTFALATMLMERLLPTPMT